MWKVIKGNGPGLARIPAAFALIAGVSAGWAPLAPAAEPDPSRLMERVEERDTGETQISQQTMILRDASGGRRQRQMTQYVRDGDRVDRRLIRFREPPDVEGTAFLDIDRERGEDEQFLYLPELGDTRRIANANQSESFMGSDFTYADLSERNTEDWEYGLTDRVSVRGHKVWKIAARPANDEVRQRYGYERATLYVDPERLMVLRASYETTGDERKFLDIRDIRKVEGVWIAHELEMRTMEGGSVVHATLLKRRDVRIDEPLGRELAPDRLVMGGQ